MSRRPVCRGCGAKRHEDEPHTPACDRVLVLGGGGAICPCGSQLEWTGALDADGEEWLADWQASHEYCEAS